MNELKTLEDLGTKNSAREDGTWTCMSCNNPEYVELKAEAVKWVKHFGAEMIYKDFMEFFNLTEEDLKDERT